MQHQDDGKPRRQQASPGRANGGGATRDLTLPLALNAWQLRQTSALVVAEIDALLDHHTEAPIAALLNERGFASGEGKPLCGKTVQRIRRSYGLRKRYDRLRDAGMLTTAEVARPVSSSPLLHCPSRLVRATQEDSCTSGVVV